MLQVLREAGVDAHYLSLVDEEDAEYYRFMFGERFANPRALSNVAACCLEGRLNGPHPELTRAIEDVAPAVMLGIGSIAARLMKQACPGRRLVFLTTGCQQMKTLIERGEVEDFIAQREVLVRSRGRPPIYPSEEREAVLSADLIITHAEVVRFLYRSFFPSQAGKIWPDVISFGEWILGEASAYDHLGRPFLERDIDVLFVASSWTRPEKNFRLVRRIASGLRRTRIHLVGDVESACPGAVHHGFVADRTALFGLLGRAKTVVCPSAFDAAPGVLFEASAMGCNVVASPNCGNSRLCHEELLAARGDAREFIRAIRASLAKKYDDHADAFLGTASTRRLIDVLMVA